VRHVCPGFRKKNSWFFLAAVFFPVLVLTVTIFWREEDENDYSPGLHESKGMGSQCLWASCWVGCLKRPLVV